LGARLWSQSYCSYTNLNERICDGSVYMIFIVLFDSENVDTHEMSRGDKS